TSTRRWPPKWPGSPSRCAGREAPRINTMHKPRALRSGDRIALVAPASPFSRESFDAGVAELRRLGYEPVYDDSVFARHRYLAGDAALRADSFRRAWTDPSIAALMGVRGGYGSVHLLPRLDAQEIARTPKAFIGYSDNTSLLDFLTRRCRVLSFHGPMIDGRLAKGEQAYDRDSFARVLTQPSPAGCLKPPQLEALRGGEAAGVLVGGTLAQRPLSCWSAAHGGSSSPRSARPTRSIPRRGTCSSSTKSPSARIASIEC